MEDLGDGSQARNPRPFGHPSFEDRGHPSRPKNPFIDEAGKPKKPLGDLPKEPTQWGIFSPNTEDKKAHFKRLRSGRGDKGGKRGDKKG